VGRRRKAGNEWLPERVYPGKSAYEFRPDKNTCIKLCPIDAARRVVLKRHAEELAKFEVVEGSFAHLVDLFIESPAFRDLAPRTQKDYRRYKNTVLKVFGKMQAELIRPEHIRRYMDIRGEETQVQANREHSFMSKVFSWGYERGRVSINPCHKVSKFSEEARTRYITDSEYQAVYDEANAYIKAAMEISYCCATRQGDIIELKHDQLREEGIFIRQGKTNKAQIKRWTPRLRAAIKLLRQQTVVANRTYLFVDKQGQRITGHKLRQWWRKARDDAENKAREEQMNMNICFDFTFHDIKAKSISDWEGDKQNFSGHKTRSQVEVYDRKVPVVDTHD
jgi:integrase